ncbi:DUF3578 domain-containing protein [Candidatus Saccharibacteria bacterium]|nr:DUF3578 domain-containing protein [Candidatus Saccharibacteria bacterium]
MQLQDIFNKIFDAEEYLSAKRASYSKTNPFYKFFDDDIPRAMRTIVNQLQYPLTITYECKGSIGAGVLADTFWFNVMNPQITNDPQKGVYIVYLVAPAGDSIYLCLIQSTGIIMSDAQLDQIKPKLKERAKKIHDAFNQSLVDQGCLDALDKFKFGSINLGPNLSLTSRAYEAAVILSKTYDKSSDVLTEMDLRDDLKAMLDVYKRYYTLERSGKV